MKARTLAGIYLLFAVGFVAGSTLVYLKAWPFGLYEEFSRFVAGDATEKTTVVDKILNDADLRPTRFLHQSANAALARQFGLKPVGNEDGAPDFSAKRQQPLFHSSNSEGAYLVSGVFDFDGGLSGVLLVDHGGRIIRAWPYSQNGDEWSAESDLQADGLGFELLPDGSFLARLGRTLYRRDRCGKVLWKIGGRFHHSIAADGAGAFWTWRDDYMVRAALDDGHALEEIHIEDVIKANPDITAFEMLTKPGDWKWRALTARTTLYAATPPKDSPYYIDPFHQNDVDPLTPEKAVLFPDFQPGDVLVSMRHINIVFVMRPSTLKILWFRQGYTSRQHDPDWSGQGTISVFDNRNHQDASRIAEFHPAELAPRLRVDGAAYQIYTDAGGSHETMPDGGTLIISRNQGRMLHLRKDGSIAFDFLNVYDETSVLRLYDARFIPESEVLKWKDC